MYYQKQNPYPADWWTERTRLGISRNTLAWILIFVVLGLAFYGFDWDWIFGQR